MHEQSTGSRYRIEFDRIGRYKVTPLVTEAIGQDSIRAAVLDYAREILTPRADTGGISVVISEDFRHGYIYGGFRLLGTCSITPQGTSTPLRDLIRAAHAAGWDHSTAAFSNGRGGWVHPFEHTWERGEDRVSYEGGELRYWRDGHKVLRARVGSVEQAIALLAAYGLPAVTR